MSAALSDSKPPGQYYCPTCERSFLIGDRCPTDGTRLVRITAPTDPLLGKELDGRYQITEKLGQGGMGAVYRGRQLGLGREVAIKVVSAHLVSEPDVVKRFLREAKLASRLTHPNAVAVLDFNQTEDGLFYLVMELVSGRTLDKAIEDEHLFKPSRLVRIGTQICDALEGAHSLSIVHRDLKPSNIMLLSSGRDLVKVLDFGLAKSVAPDQAVTTMTNAGALLGTPAFMPPELALGQPCDGRADLYSLGVILYLLGSGKLPFISDSVHELIAMQGTETAPPMFGVPPAIAQVIDRMLQKHPDDRFQTAADNREALEEALQVIRMTTSTPTTGASIVQMTQTNPGIVVPATPTPLPSAMHAVGVSETITPLEMATKRTWLPFAIGGGVIAVIAIFAVFATTMKSAPPTGTPGAAMTTIPDAVGPSVSGTIDATIPAVVPPPDPPPPTPKPPAPPPHHAAIKKPVDATVKPKPPDLPVTTTHPVTPEKPRAGSGTTPF